LPGAVPAATFPDAGGLTVRCEIQFIGHGVGSCKFGDIIRKPSLTGFFTPGVTLPTVGPGPRDSSSMQPRRQIARIANVS
jgi:hypothetical protein